jgi:hypothetical protein
VGLTLVMLLMLAIAAFTFAARRARLATPFGAH